MKTPQYQHISTKRTTGLEPATFGLGSQYPDKPPFLTSPQKHPVCRNFPGARNEKPIATGARLDGERVTKGSRKGHDA